MDIEICNRICQCTMLPKAIGRYKNGKWYAFFSTFNWRCSVLQIEPMDEFFKNNEKAVSRNWTKVTDNLRKCDEVTDYWRYVGGNYNYVLSNVKIISTSDCSCKCIVEQTLSNIKHLERSKKIRQNEKIDLPDGLSLFTSIQDI